MNKYKNKGEEFEKKGYLKSIYKDSKITICNLCDCCYYVFYNDTGLAINIRPDAIRQVISDPKRTLKAYRKLPDNIKVRVSFYINSNKMEEVMLDVIRKIKENPQLSVTDPVLEEQIMQEYGMNRGKKI